MNFKVAMLATAFSLIYALPAGAAQELSAEKAAELKPFKRINLNGRFNSLIDASQAVNVEADKQGAASFYVQGMNDINSNGGNATVTADLYANDAEKVQPKVVSRRYYGVTELPKSQAYRLEPFDTVTVSGYYPSQPAVIEAIAKAARAKNAASFFIVRQIEANNGGNQFITAYVYKADAKQRQVQDPQLIPADSEAGKAALAAGGVKAQQVETPGVASSGSPVTKVGRFFETQSSTNKRYTVQLPNGKKVQELSGLTAAQMTPFTTITLTDHFGTPVEVSDAVGRMAADKGAKYFHIVRQWQNQSGGNLTVTAELFK